MERLIQHKSSIEQLSNEEKQHFLEQYSKTDKGLEIMEKSIFAYFLKELNDDIKITENTVNEIDSMNDIINKIVENREINSVSDEEEDVSDEQEPLRLDVLPDSLLGYLSTFASSNDYISVRVLCRNTYIATTKHIHHASICKPNYLSSQNMYNFQRLQSLTIQISYLICHKLAKQIYDLPELRKIGLLYVSDSSLTCLMYSKRVNFQLITHLKMSGITYDIVDHADQVTHFTLIQFLKYFPNLEILDIAAFYSSYAHHEDDAWESEELPSLSKLNGIAIGRGCPRINVFLIKFVHQYQHQLIAFADTNGYSHTNLLRNIQLKEVKEIKLGSCNQEYVNQLICKANNMSKFNMQHPNIDMIPHIIQRLEHLKYIYFEHIGICMDLFCETLIKIFEPTKTFNITLGFGIKAYKGSHILLLKGINLLTHLFDSLKQNDNNKYTVFLDWSCKCNPNNDECEIMRILATRSTDNYVVQQNQKYSMCHYFISNDTEQGYIPHFIIDCFD